MGTHPHMLLSLPERHLQTATWNNMKEEVEDGKYERLADWGKDVGEKPEQLRCIKATASLQQH